MKKFLFTSMLVAALLAFTGCSKEPDPALDAEYVAKMEEYLSIYETYQNDCALMATKLNEFAEQKASSLGEASAAAAESRLGFIVSQKVIVEAFSAVVDLIPEEKMNISTNNACKDDDQVVKASYKCSDKIKKPIGDLIEAKCGKNC